MRTPFGKLLIFVLLVLTVCPRGLALTSNESISASALLDRFETVFYAKSEIVSTSKAYDGFSQFESATFHYPFSLLPGALHSLGETAFNEIFRGSEAVLVGAKDFRAPEGSDGLGQVRSQFCYVVILKGNSGVQLSKYFSKAELPSTSAAAWPVWQWSAKLNEFGRDDPRPTSLYFTEVEQSYLLVSNDLQDLQDIAGRLASSDHDVQSLSKVRDWDTITRHQFWGYRRYRHAGVINPVAAGTTGVTPGAEALTFSLDLDKRVGVIRLFSSLTDEGSAAKLNARAMLPPLKRASPGIWEAKILLSGDERSAQRMFGVMYLFGFGIYL